MDLGLEVLKQIYQETRKDTRKFYCQLLNKLHIPEGVDEWKGRNALLLVSQLDLVGTVSYSCCDSC
jgi:condensin complex subunit 3